MCQEAKLLLYRVSGGRLRLRELFFAEESEETNADAELGQEANPKPGLREAFRPASGEVGEGRSWSDGVETVSPRDDGCDGTDALSGHYCTC